MEQLHLEQPMDTEIFIELIRSYPALYSKGNRNYKDSVIQNNIWNEISVTMDRSSKYLTY